MVEIDRGRMVRNNRQICIQMEQLANGFMAKAELTAVQAHILQYIFRHCDRGTSLTEIHRDFGCSMAALSGMVKRLREKGYIRAECCAGDDRRKLLFPTEKGRQIQPFLDKTTREIQHKLYGCLSREELTTLDRLQNKLLDNLIQLTHTKTKEVSNS